ncbi:MAG: hypothetical protein IPK64_17580 [bacterium]|nr:hypothetical protein [bacterium]
MSNLNARDKDPSNTPTPDTRTWKQKYGTSIMIGVFALLAVVMVLMQKKAAH